MSTRAQWSCDPFLMDVAIRPGDREKVAELIADQPDAHPLAAMMGVKL